MLQANAVAASKRRRCKQMASLRANSVIASKAWQSHGAVLDCHVAVLLAMTDKKSLRAKRGNLMVECWIATSLRSSQ
jgi:hypothetical protein